MTRSISRATLVALALVPATLVAACGDAEPARTPEPAPVAPAAPVKPAAVKPAAPVQAPETVPATALTPAEPAPAEERNAAAAAIIDQLDSVRDVAAGLGVDLSDEDLAQVAKYVDGAVTEEKVAAALKKFGTDNPEAAIGALADKVGVDVGGIIPGMGGAEATAESAADALKKRAGGAAEQADPDAAKEALEGVSIDQLKAERKAAITALEVEQEKALVDLRAKFAERSKRNPAKAAEHAQKLADKEAELEADYASKIEAVRADFKKRIKAAR